MKSKLSYDLKGHIINKNSLLKLMEKCDLLFNNSELELKFKNAEILSELSSKEFENLDLDNLRVEYFEYTASSYDVVQKNLYIVYNSINNSYSISFSCDDRDSFYKIKGVIDDWMRSTKSSYSRIMCFVNSFFVNIIVFSIYLILIYLGVYFFTTNNDLSISVTTVISGIAGVIIPVFSFSTISLLRKLFPSTEIDFGENPSKKKRYIIYSLLTVIVIPLIFTLIGIFWKV